jgi:amidophosphoribosyltransferase
MKDPFDKLHEYCAIFGIYNIKEAANYVYLGLHALQHRGQEGCGIVTRDKDVFYKKRARGLVLEAFDKTDIENLKGDIGIGHNRYSTSGDSSLVNLQPLTASFDLGDIAIAHNGNIVNAYSIRQKLISDGAIFSSNSDTEVIIHLIARQKGSFDERLVGALSQLKGAFSLVMLFNDTLYAIKDPWGFRPLAMGELGDSCCFASETCAFDLIGAKFVRELESGEIVKVDKYGVNSFKPFKSENSYRCVFEHIYFARPDSYLWDNHVYEIRKRIGQKLALKSSVDADIVIAVPDSGMPAAIGYSQASGLPFEMGIIRNHYVGRTFIEPTDSIRHFGVKLKLNPSSDVLNNKRVVVVDDSIVRGTTSRRIVKMIRNAGAKEVHLRIASPPVTHPCFYGIDTPTKSELIASSHTIEEITKYATADSIAYLTLEDLKEIVGESGYCYACFSGNYPISLNV